MKVLALESTTDRVSLALLEDGELLGERSYAAGRYSETILLSLDALLSEAGVALQTLDGLAVGTGPGSFTGVRVGIATAKALAQAIRRPLVGIPALDILALQPSWEGWVVAALDAKRGEVYWAPHQASPRLSPLADFCREVEALRGPVLLVGTVLLLPEIAERNWSPHVTLGAEGEARPRAAVLAMLSGALFPGLGWESLFSVQPLYWRPADALKLSERKARSR